MDLTKEIFDRIIADGMGELPGLVEGMRKMLDDSLAAGTDSVAPQMMVAAFNYRTAKMEHSLYYLAVDFNEHDEKHRTMQGIGARMHRAKQFPIALAFASEAWASKQDGDGPHPQPRHDPARREILLLLGRTVTKTTQRLTRPVRREAGKLVPAGDWEETVGGKMETPLLDSIWCGYQAALLVDRPDLRDDATPPPAPPAGP